MNITKFAIEKNRITAVALILILFAGINTFRTMPRAEDPGFTIRWALITTDFPGASPERVEKLVTDKLEKAIQDMPEIDFIYSESKTGFSSIMLGIKEHYTEMRPIWDKLRRKVERTKNRGELPEDSGPPSAGCRRPPLRRRGAQGQQRSRADGRSCVHHRLASQIPEYAPTDSRLLWSPGDGGRRPPHGLRMSRLARQS